MEYLILEETRFRPYLDFIESCKKKNPKRFHRHHIVPKHMGGEDSEDNLIKLGYKDHREAHLILAECFPIESEGRWKNLLSANYLNHWTTDEVISNGWIVSEETIEKMKKSKKGIKATTLKNFIRLYGKEEGRKRYEDCYNKGRNNLNSFIERYGEQVGLQKYNEYRNKISQKQKAYVKTEEHCRNISKAKKGKSTGPCSEEQKKKISKALKGRIMSKEHIEKTRRYKPCMVDGVKYKSMKDAGIAHGVSKTTILNRIRDDRFPNYTW